MIARTLPSLDQMLGAVPAASPSGETAGATAFDQLMASLTLPQAGQQAASQPGKMTPISFQPAVPKAETPSPALSLVKPETAPALPGTIKVTAPEGEAVQTTTVTADGQAETEIAAETAAPAAPQALSATPQTTPDVAAILAAVGTQVPVQMPATSIKAEAAAAIAAPAIFQNVVAQPVSPRTGKPAKATEATFAVPVSDQAAAHPFTLDAKVEAPAASTLPGETEMLLTKVDAAPVILLHKQTPGAINVATPAPVSDIAAIQTELASQSLETRLDVARDAQWIDRAAKDIAQLANGEGRLRFRLDPDHLGSLQIDMANGSDGLSMRMTTETEAARLILADAQPRLIAEARAQGVRIAESHVDLGQQSSGGGRNAPQEPVIFNRDQTFDGETAETTARPSNERFA